MGFKQPLSFFDRGCFFCLLIQKLPDHFFPLLLFGKFAVLKAKNPGKHQGC